jgi:hypothetical protein
MARDFQDARAATVKALDEWNAAYDRREIENAARELDGLPPLDDEDEDDEDDDDE